MTGAVSNVVGGCFAMAAFAVAVVAGLAGGNAASSILSRALVAMIVCYPVGLAIGLVCQRVVADHLKMQRDAHSAGESAEPAAEQSVQNAEEAEDVIVV